jgi:hypothetical protein|nr:MAG TPA: hypothetical protein [Caudoviricetes sp.]
MSHELLAISTDVFSNLEKVTYFDLPKFQDKIGTKVKVMFKLTPDQGIGFDVLNVKVKRGDKAFKTETGIVNNEPLVFKLGEDFIELDPEATTDNVMTPTLANDLARYFD